MQPFRTVQEILHQMQRLHEQSLRRLESAVEQAEDNRRAAVVTYLRDLEAELVRALARFDDSDDDALDSYVQSMPASTLEQAIAWDTYTASVDATIDDLLQACRERDERLVRLYELLEASVGPRARAIFEDLAELKRTQQKRLQQSLLDF